MHKSQVKEERKPGGIFSRGYFAKSSSSLQDGGEKWFNQGGCKNMMVMQCYRSCWEPLDWGVLGILIKLEKEASSV